MSTPGARLAQLGPGAAVLAPAPVLGVELLGRGGERLAQWEVQVHGPRAPPGGGVEGTAGQRAVVDRRVAPGLVGAHLDKPFGRASVEPQLVDRLSRSHAAQLGRTVGGQHDQRHAGLPRLDHGGVKVGRRAAGRAGDGYRAAARLGHSQSGETGAALVDHRDRLEPRLARERERERRVARARTGDRVGHAAAHQFLHESPDRGEGPVDRLHHRRTLPNRVRHSPRSPSEHTRFHLEVSLCLAGSSHFSRCSPPSWR